MGTSRIHSSPVTSEFFGEVTIQNCWGMYSSFDALDFDLSLLPTSVLFFNSCVIGSDESEWDFVSGNSSSPHTPAIVQITLSSFKLHLSLCEGDCFNNSCNKTLKWFQVCYASRIVCVFMKINFPACITKYFVTRWHFTLKIGSDDCDGFIGPN